VNIGPTPLGSLRLYCLSSPERDLPPNSFLIPSRVRFGLKVLGGSSALIVRRTPPAVSTILGRKIPVLVELRITTPPI